MFEHIILLSELFVAVWTREGEVPWKIRRKKLTLLGILRAKLFNFRVILVKLYFIEVNLAPGRKNGGSSVTYHSRIGFENMHEQSCWYSKARQIFVWILGECVVVRCVPGAKLVWYAVSPVPN
uniref:Uncharacterized protein n=1 Tax=Cacopsylla melanoneura TaxID=428564 RepID=A0A8D8ZDQ8_9HEMI